MTQEHKTKRPQTCNAVKKRLSKIFEGVAESDEDEEEEEDDEADYSPLQEAPIPRAFVSAPSDGEWALPHSPNLEYPPRAQLHNANTAIVAQLRHQMAQVEKTRQEDVRMYDTLIRQSGGLQNPAMRGVQQRVSNADERWEMLNKRLKEVMLRR